MGGLFLTLRLLLAGASLAGYGLLLHRRCGVKAEFLPAVVFSSLICLLFCAGLAGLLAAAVPILTAGGLVCLALSLLGRSGSGGLALRELLPFGMVFFLAGCLYFVLFLRGARLYAYDDFSHWGAIVRELQQTGALPGSPAVLVTFPDYPPGSALFVYYLTELIGPGESRMLMGQLFLTLSFAVTPFAFAGRGRRALTAKLACAAGILLMLSVFPQALTTLLVDTLLPLSALAATAVLLYYRKRPGLAALLSIPLTGATLLIKNSGVFFAAVNLILLLVLAVRAARRDRGGGRGLLIRVLAGLLLPLCLLGAWRLHVRLTFPPEALQGHHAVSLESYARNYAEKTDEQRAALREQFLERATDPDVRYTRIMLLLSEAAALLWLACRLVWKRRMNGLLGAALLMDGLYLLYLFGIYLTYLFSMPAAEAASLEAFRRYALTMVVYAVGVVLIAGLIDAGRERPPAPGRLVAGTLLLVFGYSLFLIKGWEPFFQRPVYEETRPYPLDRAIAREADAGRTTPG